MSGACVIHSFLPEHLRGTIALSLTLCFLSRGWAESLKLSSREPRGEPESLPVGFRPPYRTTSAWQWADLPARPGPGQSQSLTRTPKQTAGAPYRESQLLHGKR